MERVKTLVERIKYFKNWISISFPFNRVLNNNILRLRTGIRIGTRGIIGDDYSVVHENFVRDDYGLKDLELERPLIIDAGANIGAFTLAAAARFKDGKIYAFEPDEANYRLLVNNIKLNKLYHNVFPKKLAISDRTGKQKFYLTYWDYCHTLDGDSAVGYTVDQKTVDAVSLTDFVRENGITDIDILKLDIEGAEKVVIPSLPDEILRKIKYLLIEYHGCDYNQYIKDKGFSARVSPGRGNVYIYRNQRI